MATKKRRHCNFNKSDAVEKCKSYGMELPMPLNSEDLTNIQSHLCYTDSIVRNSYTSGEIWVSKSTFCKNHIGLPDINKLHNFLNKYLFLH